MLFPVRLLEANQTIKELALPDGVSYIVTRKGFYKRVKTVLFEYIVKCDGEEIVDLAEEIEPMAKAFIKAIPRGMLLQIEAYFRAAYEKYKGEAVVLLYFNPVKKDWMVNVPKQKVRGMHVDYDPVQCPGEIDGYFLASSVHSHAGASAFHSGTDDKDEVEFDGLHITIGNVDKAARSYSARWMLGKTVFTADLKDVLELETEELPKFPDAWMEQIEEDRVIMKQASGKELARAGVAHWPGMHWGQDHLWDDYEKYSTGPIGMDETPAEKPETDKVNTERDVVPDPFALIHDFEALVEEYKR